MFFHNKLNKDYSRNVKLDYVYSFMRYFDVTSAIWVLYMGFRGMSLFEIGIAEGVFHVTSMIFEVPSGAIADLFGRRKVMIAGRLLSMLSAIMMLNSTTLWMFCLSFMVSALNYNLNSGTEDALVYDSMKASGIEDKYLKVCSRLNVIIEFAQGIGTMLGGILAEGSFMYVYMMDFVLSAVSIIPLLFMQEPPVGDLKDNDEDDRASQKELNQGERNKEKISFVEHFKTVFHILKESPQVVKIILYYPMLSAFNAVLYFYSQEYFAEFNFNKIQISTIMLVSSIASCLMVLQSERLLKRYASRLKYMTSIIMGMMIVLCSVPGKYLVIVFFVISNMCHSLVEPLESSSLNSEIPSEQRATIISIDSMAYSIEMILAFPVCGFIAGYIGLARTFIILGSIELLTVTAYLLWKKLFNCTPIVEK